MQFEVPQFIEIEDKIIGPFTWRQFVYLAGAAGVSAMLLLAVHWLAFIVVGIPILLLAAALSFYPVNNRPFIYFVESAYNYVRRQKLYLWKQKQEIIHKQSFAPQTHVQNPMITTTNPTPKKNISSLARKLELQALQKQSS